MEQVKVCKECGKELSIEKFKNNGHGGVRDICCDCMARKISEGLKKNQ